MSRTSAPAQYILILIDMVENQGYAREELLAGTSLAHTGVADLGARVAEEDFARLVSNAFALTGDPALGLHMGLRLNLSAHAVLGQAFMTCRDLGQVMDLFIKYYHLLASPSLHLEYSLTDDRCVLTTVSAPQDNPLEFGSEMMYSAMLNTLRGLLGLPNLQLRIELPYPAPAHAASYYGVFGDDVHFDAVLGRISFPGRYWPRRCPCRTRPCVHCMKTSALGCWQTWRDRIRWRSRPCACCASSKDNTRKCHNWRKC